MSALTPGTPVRLVRGEEQLLGEVAGPSGFAQAIRAVDSLLNIDVLEAAGWVVSPVEPPTPAIPTEPGWYSGNTEGMYPLHPNGFWLFAPWQHGAVVSVIKEPLEYAPFTRLASRGVWQTEIVEEIATAVGAFADDVHGSATGLDDHTWGQIVRRSSGIAEAATYIRNEFGSVVGE